MKKSDQLKQERQSKLDAQQSLITLRSADPSGNFTEEQRSQFDALQAEVEALDASIKREMQVEAVALRNAATAATPVAGAQVVDGEQKEYGTMLRSYSLHKAMRHQLEEGNHTGVEGEILQELQKRAGKAGINQAGLLIPNPESRADAQTVTQDAGGFGANLVSEDLRGPIEFLRANPIVRQMGATYLSGLQGNVAFSVNNGGIDASWEGEITQVPATKNAYGKKGMTPHRLASRTQLSLQNIYQSNIDLERFTAQEIGTTRDLKLDETAINGSGVGEIPLGLLNHNDITVIAAGVNGGAPTWGQVVDLETGPADANFMLGGPAGYLINTATKGRLKQTKHEAGDLGYLMSAQNEINGYGVGVSNLVPGNLTKGTSNGTLSAAIFGYWRELILGEWGFMDLVMDRVTLADQGQVKIVVNSFHDILVRHEKAFAAVKDWDLTA